MVLERAVICLAGQGGLSNRYPVMEVDEAESRASAVDSKKLNRTLLTVQNVKSTVHDVFQFLH